MMQKVDVGIGRLKAVVIYPYSSSPRLGQMRDETHELPPRRRAGLLRQ